MKAVDRVPKRNNVARVQRLARERADAQARRIPWQRLLDTRNESIDWQEFYLWVRSILEAENRIPDWLVATLNTRCPGFLENDKRQAPKAAKNRPLALRLEDWIDDHVFGLAKQEGWFSAITYYAIREPRPTKEPKSAGRNPSRGGRKPSRSGILHLKNGGSWLQGAMRLRICCLICGRRVHQLSWLPPNAYGGVSCIVRAPGVR